MEDLLTMLAAKIGRPIDYVIAEALGIYAAIISHDGTPAMIVDDQPVIIDITYRPTPTASEQAN